MVGDDQILQIFRDEGVLPVDGMVVPEGYEAAKANCEKFKHVFLNSSKDEEKDQELEVCAVLRA